MDRPSEGCMYMYTSFILKNLGPETHHRGVCRVLHTLYRLLPSYNRDNMVTIGIYLTMNNNTINYRYNKPLTLLNIQYRDN